MANTGPQSDLPPGAAAQRAARLAQLFEAHNAALVQLLRVRLRSNQEARDVAQEAYLRLLQLEQLGDVEYLRAYLFRTALNIATDRGRANAMRAAAHRDPALAQTGEAHSPEAALAAVESLHAVQRALNSLPARERYAFLLHRVAELHVDKVARHLGVSRRSVQAYVVKALLRCEAAVERAHRELSRSTNKGNPT
jgi:RNA polymerase sigma-70 factor (ECF subfamily)